MTKLADQLTDTARDAQRNPTMKNPHLFSSPMWLCFEAGRKCADLSAINFAKVSRGYSVRLETVGGSKLLVKWHDNALASATVENI